MDNEQTFWGVLKSFSPKDGYGFISCPLLREAFGRDVYINHSQLPPGASSGCKVEFTISISVRGQPQAQRVILLQDAPMDLVEAEQSLNQDFLNFTQVEEAMHQFHVTIDKRAGKGETRLGIDVDTTHGPALLVDSVTKGLVQEWNKQNPHLQVKRGDLIVEVNGVTGDALTLFKQCKNSKLLRMRLCKGTPDIPTPVDGGERTVLPSVCVASWNVLASAYTSMKMYPDVDPAILRASRRRAQCKAALAQVQADVICLQEVDCSLEELGLCPDRYDSVYAQRPQGRCDRCVIAWDKTRLEVGPKGHKMVIFDEHPPPAAFECDPAHYETGNVGICVELRDPGKHCFTVATTHLCWEPHKMDVRQWQLHTFVHQVSSLGGRRILLCGDLNSQPGTQPHQFLAQGCGLGSAYSDVENTAVTNSNAHACPGGFAAMIDYIWYSAKWFSVRKRIHLPTSDELRQLESSNPGDPVPTLLSPTWPSDHLMLGVVLELTNPPVLDDDDFD